MIEKEFNRIVTSVSISPEMEQIIKDYKISPTEVFRVGMAVTLAEMGFAKYRTTLNESRIQMLKANKDEAVEILEDIKTNINKLVEFVK